MADTHNIPTSNAVAVGFYRGTSTKLNALTSYKDGAFYITTDTDRLYYAQSANELVQLNKSIQVVTAFPTAGQLVGEFYYNTSTRELAYYGGKAGGVDQWVHVNYYEDTSIRSLEVSDAASDKNGLTFTLSLTEKDKEGRAIGVTKPDGTFEITTLTDTFKITKDQINALVVHPDIPDLGDIQVTLGASVSNGTATVTLGGQGAASSGKSFTITGEKDATVSGSNNAIKISAKSYDITNKTGTNDAAEAAITLKNSDNAAKGKISFTDDDKDIVITPTDNVINIAHKTYAATSKDGANLTTGTVTNGGTITVVKGVDLSNGHVTGIRTGSFTLPTIPDDKYATAVNANNTGEITITMNQGAALKSGQDLYYIINGKTVYNQGDLTDDVKEIIEKNLSKVTNAMTFKGSLTGGSTASAATAIADLDNIDINKISIGDVYIVKSGFIAVNDFADIEDIAGIGDMIIASSSDDTETDGFIPAEKLKWTVIEGTETDTTYTISAANNKLTLTPSTGSAQNIALVDDDIVTLTSTGDKITANHKKYASAGVTAATTAEKTLAFGGTDSIDVIVGYTDDDYGHVQNLHKTTLKLPALPDQTNDHTLSVASNKITLKNAASAEKGSVTIDGGTALTASTSGTTITINHDSISCTNPETVSGDATELVDNTEFTVVNGLTVNAQGHVTAVSKAKYKAQDTQYKLGKAKSGTHAEGHAGLSVANNIATVTNYLYTTDGAAAGVSAFKLASQNDHMVISKDSTTTNQINIGLVWGTF